MEEQEIKKFIEQVKLKSTYGKFLKTDIIYQLIKLFDSIYEKQSYSNEIENPLEMALEFYKEYNIDYYNIIIDNIQNKKLLFAKIKVNFLPTQIIIMLI